MLHEFCRRYPAVHPEVQLDDGKSDWVLDRVDVGFRVGASTDEGVIARRLFPVQLTICAAPGYLARHGVPRTLADLSAHRCSAFRHRAGAALVPAHRRRAGAPACLAHAVHQRHRSGDPGRAGRPGGRATG
ncbi:MAG: LysR substrate-binding domain-containing protein [Aquabacterium sp.]|uniref:LysR substrate-binding domain-containing protein n=1 Tax=Aquabacterium sp. TaxID=1872578 RepID=UPI003BAFFDBF